MTIQCPTCHGNKTVLAHINTGEDSSEHYWADVPCITCEGAGEITDEQMTSIQEGTRMKQERLDRGELLIHAAKRLGMSPAQLSGIEHGRPVRKLECVNK